MQKKQISPISAIWICNLILLITYIIGGPSLSFLKSSILEYNNIASDPFDGAVSPIAYVPDWSKTENTNKSRLFESFDISDFIDIPEYDSELLSDTPQQTTAASILRYTYPVVYMGSYRGNHTEYDGSHCAVDIRAPLGTPVVSVANGVVVKVKNTETGDGKYVVIRHDGVDIDGMKETLYSGYEHLGEIVAIEGMKIKRGEVLGKVGMTGITTTPHLHFQIDKSTSPFHLYWPYSFREAANLGLDFFGAINVGLGKENAIRYTINPMDFIKNRPFLGSAPKEISTAIEIKKDPIILSSEMVADNSMPGMETNIPAVVEEKPEPAITKQIETPIPKTIDTSIAIVPTFTPDNTHFFSDIPSNSPFYEATKYLSEAGVARGYEDGGFHPADTITRKETILLYARLFDIGPLENAIWEFSDILPSDEVYPYLARSVQDKIVAKAYLFRPNAPLSRAEAITLLVRTAKLPLATGKYTAFRDVKLKNTHREYINTFASYLKIRGTNFSPDQAITRGELAKILYTFDQKRKKESD